MKAKKLQFRTTLAIFVLCGIILAPNYVQAGLTMPGGTVPPPPPPDPDRDNDGLLNVDEATYGCDPDDPDTDNDGLNDGYEVAHNPYDSIPTDSDSDNDGLSDKYEMITSYYQTDPRDSDTDNDGLSDYWEMYNEFQYHTNPIKYDTDGDGLNDKLEVYTYHTLAWDADTDNDGLNDGYEVANNPYDSNPKITDSDGDGLSDPYEMSANPYVTDPKDADTDNDGLSDKVEINTYGTNPKDYDSDNDGLSDGVEINTYGSNPKNSDTDYDLIEDDDEVNTYHTDPVDSDTDHDGLGDYAEVFIEPTDPLDPDSDNDQLEDGDEYIYGCNPLDSDTDDDGLLDGIEVMEGMEPTVADTDGDGLSDYWEFIHEVQYHTDPTKYDTDNDGLNDRQEVENYLTLAWDPDTDNDGLLDGDEVNIYGTNPLHTDTDHDGLNDGQEVNTYSTNPLDSDSDNDGLTDNQEINSYGTNPLSTDSDGDSYFDLWEITYGFDPLDNTDHPVDSEDPDLDDLVNSEENIQGTNPFDPDTDGDDLTDGEEVYRYNGNPLDSASPATNIGHFNTDSIGSEPNNWDILSNSDNLVTVIDGPDWGINSPDSQILEIRDESGYLNDGVIQGSFDSMVSDTSKTYYHFKMGISSMDTSHFQAVAKIAGLTLKMFDSKVTLKLIEYHDGDYGFETYEIFEDLDTHRMYDFDIVIGAPNRVYDLTGVTFRYMATVQIWIGGERVYSYQAYDCENDVASLRFEGNRDLLCPTGVYSAYFDEIRIGNVQDFEYSVIDDKQIPIVIGRLYAPNVGGYHPIDEYASYHQISITTTETFSVELSAQINGEFGPLSGSYGKSITDSVTLESTDVIKATIDTGDKIYGKLYTGDLIQFGYQIIGASDYCVVDYRIEQNPSYQITIFSVEVDDFSSEFSDVLADGMEITLPDPKSQAIYEGIDQNAIISPLIHSGSEYIYRDETYTVEKSQSIDCSISFEFFDIKGKKMSFDISRVYTETFGISYHEEVVLYHSDTLEVHLGDFTDYRSLGCWFL